MREKGVSPGRVPSSIELAVRRAIAWSLAAAAALAFLASAHGAEPPGANPHSHFMAPESCPRCHLPGAEGRPDPARFSPEADAFCLECHRGESLGRSHPTAVRPADRFGRGIIPADFPLAVDGRMICLTCHVAHGPYLTARRSYPEPAFGDRAAAAGSGYRTFFLRRSDPALGAAPLCGACHRVPR